MTAMGIGTEGTATCRCVFCRYVPVTPAMPLRFVTNYVWVGDRQYEDTDGK